MDSKPIGNAPAKRMKFVPKAPGRRPETRITPKTEVADEADDFEKKELMRLFHESQTGRPKMERKSQPVRVAFGAGAAMPSSYYKNPKADPLRVKQEEEYIEPWDYEGSYVPTVLPLRQPYSGNPGVLDEAEFGKAAEAEGFDENRANAAAELGLMEESLEPRLLFLQLPKLMPMMKQSAPPRQGDASSSKPPNNAAPTERICGFRELPQGQMGKMLVYKSGKVKLKLGDVLFDVNPGSNCVFAQDVVAINKKDRNCCVVGQVERRAVITPDINSILDGIADVDLGNSGA